MLHRCVGSPRWVSFLLGLLLPPRYPGWKGGHQLGLRPVGESGGSMVEFPGDHLQEVTLIAQSFSLLEEPLSRIRSR